MTTAAEQILAYIQGHGMATRPELERVFGLYEKTVDSAIRKLEGLGCIERTGQTVKAPRRKPSIVFAPTGNPVDPAKIGRGHSRHRQSDEVTHTFDALNNAMRGFFGQPTEAL